MNKAIFLDRDGIINIERGTFTYLKEDFILINEIEDSLRFFRQKNYLLIIITNQSGISLGYYTLNQMHQMHEYLISKLPKELHPDAIYYCPHHPEVSKCLCRKPLPLMVQKALARFEIDPSKSFFFGDKLRDIEAANAAGVKGILVEANTGLKKFHQLIP